ncbi:hypothetical protein BD410DRAFT_881649 [Rickenella mellea]|uniref:Nuclear pore complex protein NUP96 C-terminal domain-containing protein n=1 Tax=Rickenella mellea TaxID=50990 RepID=A0A4Y7QGQ4_9AGAM|nr:hypothetical protein BD410DRAFT_881649 [Rickenella mellea]
MHLSDLENDEELENQPIPWPQQLNLEPHRVHVMQTSLFRMTELASTQLKQPPTQLKHPRSTEALPQPKDIPIRRSFAQPRVHAPSRKYVRVASSDSIAASHEGSLLDAGLSFGRSFRVGWGPGGRLAHVGSLSSVNASTSESANSSLVRVTSIELSNTESSPPPDLLSHLLANTPITPASTDNHGIPYITHNRRLTFSSFSSLFETSDTSHVALLFHLGHALFDPLDLQLGANVNADIRHRVLSLRRSDALSSWLTRAVASKVESDIKSNTSADPARVAFLHMTGNQIEKAVEELTNCGDIRLATLVAQAPGDDEFRADIASQLRIWRDEKVDAFMSADIRKVYAILAGDVDVLEGSTHKEDVEIAKGLDWLRVFGLQLWFASFLDTPLQESFEVYEQQFQDNAGRIPRPAPWYIDNSHREETTVTDSLFSLMKLALSPSTTLESTLVPLGYGPNPRDYKLPWFIYVLLSRCMRVRDFTDREAISSRDDSESESDKEEDGYSATSDALTANFAAQLEQGGHIQEAAFVLLFLEEDLGRQRAIKELLTRCAPQLDEWNTAGLHGSLKIPREWISEAKAVHAFYEGNIYEAYELYVDAGAHQSAHDIAITYLAPEAILHDHLELLRNLFQVLDKTKISNWAVGGQVFIDYVHIVSKVPDLRMQIREGDILPDASELLDLDMLTGKIPQLIGVLPDVLREKPGDGGKSIPALSTMLANLVECLDTTKPIKVEIPPGLVDESVRLRHVHAIALDGFLKSIESLA